MSCGEPIRFIDGATLDNAKLLSPKLFEAESTNTTLNGTITLADATAVELAARIDPFLNYPVDLDLFASALHDSTNDLPLVAGTQVVTGAEFEAALAGIEANLATAKADLQHELADATDPVVIAGVLQSGAGLKLAPDTRVATYDELNAAIQTATSDVKIAGVFKNKEGNPLSPGTELMSAIEVLQAIELGICQGCGDGSGGSGTTGDGRVISGFAWNAQHTQLVITDKKVDGTNPYNWTVNVGDFYAKAPAPSAETPDFTTEDFLPLHVIGGRTSLLGTPAIYAELEVNGVTYLFPGFVKPAPLP
jgi:hypothetical protein